MDSAGEMFTLIYFKIELLPRNIYDDELHTTKFYVTDSRLVDRYRTKEILCLKTEGQHFYFLGQGNHWLVRKMPKAESRVIHQVCLVGGIHFENKAK